MARSELFTTKAPSRRPASAKGTGSLTFAGRRAFDGRIRPAIGQTCGKQDPVLWPGHIRGHHAHDQMVSDTVTMPNSTSVDSMRNLLNSTDRTTGRVPSPAPEDASECAVRSDLDQVLACDEVSVIMLAFDLRITRMAAAAQRLLDLNPAKPPRDLGDLAESVQCPELLTDARQVLDTGETASRSVLLPQGETHLVLRFYLRRSKAAELDGLLVSVVDTTERWRANSLAGHLAAIVEYSDDAILSKDLNGILTSWNREQNDCSDTPPRRRLADRSLC